MKEIDWSAIQKFYDEGGTYRLIYERFNVCVATIAKAVKKGKLKTRNNSEAQLCSKHKFRKHSEETKLKISESRKRYLKENPDKVPYVLNHYSKGDSYPEKYFEECFRGANIVKKFRFLNYELDFAEIEKKVNIEIDGDQHFLDKRIMIHDEKRNEILSQLGWTIFRVKWSEFQKLCPQEKRRIVAALIKTKEPKVNCVLYIKGNPQKDKILEYQKRQKIKTKKTVGPRPELRKVKRPAYEDLIKELNESNFCAVAKKYGVSDNAIRKWIKIYEKYRDKS